MNGVERESKHTPVTAQQVYDLFTHYLEKYLGPNSVSHKGVMTLLAQVVLESGHFRYVRNYNLGGIKTTRNWEGDWQHFTTTEYFRKSLADRYLNNPEPSGRVELIEIDKNGIHKLRISGRHSVNKFVSFSTLEAYCDHHIKLLTGLYKPATELAMVGDVRGFCFKLREIGYYTDSAERYYFNVNSLMKTYEKKIIRDESLPLILEPKINANKNEATNIETPQSVTIQEPPKIINTVNPPVDSVSLTEPSSSFLSVETNQEDDTKPMNSLETEPLPQIGKKLELKPLPWWYHVLNFILKLFTRRK